MPLESIVFNNTADIKKFAQYFVEHSLIDDAIYQQLIVDTKGNTYHLNHILKLSVAEAEALTDIQFWLAVPPTKKIDKDGKEYSQGNPPEVISLVRLKELVAVGDFSNITLNQSLIDTLRPYLQIAQSDYWVRKLKHFHGENFSEVIFDPNFNKQWVKATNGKIIYLPEALDCAKTYGQTQFKVNYNDPNSNTAENVSLLNLSELNSLAAGQWDYLEFEYDEQVSKHFIKSVNRENILEKIKKYNVEINDPNLSRHLLKATNGQVYLLEEILDVNDPAGIAEKNIFKIMNALESRDQLLKRIGRAKRALDTIYNDINDKPYSFQELHEKESASAQFRCLPEKLSGKKWVTHQYWTAAEIREISNDFSRYNFCFDEELAEAIRYPIQINYLAKDDINKQRILWPSIAYTGKTYDKYALKLSLRNISVVSETGRSLTSAQQVADNIVLQTLIMLAYKGKIHFANNKDVNQEQLQESLTVTSSNLQNAKQHNKDHIESNEKILKRFQDELKKPDLTIKGLIENQKNTKEPMDPRLKLLLQSMGTISLLGITGALVMLGLVVFTGTLGLVMLGIAAVVGLVTMVLYVLMLVALCSYDPAPASSKISDSDMKFLQKHDDYLELETEIANDEKHLEVIKNYISPAVDAEQSQISLLATQEESNPVVQYQNPTSGTNALLGRVVTPNDEVSAEPLNEPPSLKPI